MPVDNRQYQSWSNPLLLNGLTRMFGSPQNPGNRQPRILPNIAANNPNVVGRSSGNMPSILPHLRAAGIIPQVPNQPPVNPQLAGAVQGAYASPPQPTAPQPNRGWGAATVPGAPRPAVAPPQAAPPAQPQVAPAAPMMSYDQAKAQYGVQRARQMQAAGQVSG